MKKNSEVKGGSNKEKSGDTKTFGITDFFSRFEIILAIVFVLVVLGLSAFMLLPPP